MATEHRIPAPRPDGDGAAPVRAGRLIAIEGIDHSGKTTLTRALAARLQPDWRVAVVAEPSHEPIGTLFRHLSASGPAPPMAMALLSAADRHTQQRHLLRQLAAHDVVLADRYYLSGLAYHAADGLDPAFYQRLAEGIRRPDAYLMLDVDPLLAAGRAAGPADGYWEQPAFAARLPGDYHHCLDLLITSEHATVIRLDANQPAHLVTDAAWSAVTRLLLAPSSMEGLPT